MAKGILHNPQDPVLAIGEEFLKWYGTHPKDIGNIIRAVFAIYDGDWFAAARKAHDQYLGGESAGNGSLMRCLPVALPLPFGTSKRKKKSQDSSLK
ncbi:ADP-ribosylglycohydrolase family protein [Neobacillus niacini]|uniref:ADP-ribosylglycohydrolase family protein n=1 Tax=Neobacillus niacini TaxID=86668 RepID=UPI002889580A|nr:ADP-ribosylglycohydrolase family protein [Neobacillus niacini]